MASHTSSIKSGVAYNCSDQGFDVNSLCSIQHAELDIHAIHKYSNNSNGLDLTTMFKAAWMLRPIL
jgi:hypothetical protein